MKRRVLSFLLSVLLLVSLFVSCKQETQSPQVPEVSDTDTTTEEQIPLIPPPSYEIDPNASVYSGTPDVSWYEEGKTEFTLTSADQLVGFHSLRSTEFDYEGITVKLGCDMIINPGSAEELKARGAENYAWKEIKSTCLFKGTFDGQGHIISGVYMHLSEGTKGMFGSISGNATLKNFTLINSYFGGPDVAGKHSMGAIAAKVYGDGSNITFSGVNVQAILEDGTQPFNRIGGLIGSVCNSLTLTLENCQFDGSISSHGNYAGGMIGYAGGNDLKIQMKNCVNRGVIQANSCAGGMSGLLIIDHLDQTNCYNYGTINAEQEAVDLNGHFSIMSDPAKGAHPNAPEGTSALRVMSFNLQSSLSSSGGNLTQAAKNRIEAVKQEILFYQPDVLGLQEDTEKWVSNLKLPGYKAIPISVSSGAHCSIYYKSDLKLLSQGSAYLSSTGLSDDVSLTYEDLSTPGSKYYMTPEELAIIGVENSADLKEKKNTYVDQQTGQTVTMKSGTYTLLIARRVSWAVFDINGQPVIYINTHLTNSNSTAEYSNDAFQKVKSMARLKEFDLIQQQLAKIKKNYPNAKVFMTGDWNDGVNTPIYNSIVNDCGYVCANFNAKEQYGAHGTWNNAFNVSKQGDTYPSANESATSSYLDYCFVDSTISPLKFIVGAGKAEITLADGSKKIIYTSDHFPIIADICFKNQ